MADGLTLTETITEKANQALTVENRENPKAHAELIAGVLDLFNLGAKGELFDLKHVSTGVTVSQSGKFDATRVDFVPNPFQDGSGMFLIRHSNGPAITHKIVVKDAVLTGEGTFQVKSFGIGGPSTESSSKVVETALTDIALAGIVIAGALDTPKDIN